MELNFFSEAPLKVNQNKKLSNKEKASKRLTPWKKKGISKQPKKKFNNNNNNKKFVKKNDNNNNVIKKNENENENVEKFIITTTTTTTKSNNDGKIILNTTSSMKREGNDNDNDNDEEEENKKVLGSKRKQEEEAQNNNNNGTTEKKVIIIPPPKKKAKFSLNDGSMNIRIDDDDDDNESKSIPSLKNRKTIIQKTELKKEGEEKFSKDEDDEEEENNEFKSKTKLKKERVTPFVPQKLGGRKLHTEKTAVKVIEVKDDSNIHHLKPSDLNEITKKQQQEQQQQRKPVYNTQQGRSNHIFSPKSFGELSIDSKMVKHLESKGMKSCTTIQSVSIPSLLSGQNVFVKSETGSGKTLAYLIPILQQLQSMKNRLSRDDGTQCIILAPTRELCLQIYNVLESMIKPYIWLTPGLVTGGEKRKSEKARLRKGIVILVATPGRLLDHLKNTQCFERKKLKWLVLDEADRLVDMGFEKQVLEIISHLGQQSGSGNNNKHSSSNTSWNTAMVSATRTVAVNSFAKKCLKSHLFIDAKSQSIKEVSEADMDIATDVDRDADLSGLVDNDMDTFTTPEQLVQKFMLVTCKLRLPALAAFIRSKLKENKKSKIIVFMSTTDAVDFYHKLFEKVFVNAPGMIFEEEFSLYKLHGNVPQSERVQTFNAFCGTNTGVMLCTDVAARGLDMAHVDWIVQYDPPIELADYVHRIGRTARKGNKGNALIFLLPAESGYLDLLSKQGIQPGPLALKDILQNIAPPKFKKYRAPDEVFALDLQEKFEKVVQLKENKELVEMGRKTFQSFFKAYSTHPAANKHIFNVRGLHFGHVARTLGLKEAPTAIKRGQKTVNIREKTNKDRLDEARRKKEAPKQKGRVKKLTDSEYF